VAGICEFNKIQLSNFRCYLQAWPLNLTIGNIRQVMRHIYQRCSTAIVRLITRPHKYESEPKVALDRFTHSRCWLLYRWNQACSLIQNQRWGTQICVYTYSSQTVLKPIDEALDSSVGTVLSQLQQYDITVHALNWDYADGFK